MRIGRLINWHVKRMSNERAITDAAAARRVARGEFEPEGPKVSGAANWIVGVLAVGFAVLIVLSLFGL